jgi:PAS domain S-box-containing protein
MLTFKELLFTGPEAVCLIDMDFRLIEYNQITNMILGLDDGDLKGKHLTDIFHDDNIIQKLTKISKQDHWFQSECLVKTSSETPLPVKLRAGQLQNDNSQQKIYALVFREIDELQYISNSRKVSALKSLLNFVLLPDKKPNLVPPSNGKPEDMLIEFVKIYDQHATFFLLDSKSGNIDLNKDSEHFLPSKHTCLTAQLAINNKTSMFCHDENLWCFFPIYSKREIYSVACVKFSIPRLYDDEDKVLFALCGKIIGSRIEQLTTGNQSNHPEPLLQIAFDVIKQPIVAVNKKGIITKVNNSAKSFYGFTEQEMLGKSFGDLVFLADHTDRFDDLLNIVIKENSIYDQEITHIRSDFTMVEVNISAYPCKADDGTINGVVFIMQDIGQQNQLKDKIMQLEKLSVLGELLYGAANELNNSLTSVIGHSELLCHTKNEEIVNIASKIHKGSLRCGNIVNGLLDLARNDEFKKNSPSLDEVLKSAIDLKSYQLQSNNIHLNIKVDKSIPQVKVDFHDLERLILHIINYAEKRILEYKDSGEIGIEAKFDNGKVIACFTDTGTCILKQDMNEILSCYTSSASDEYSDIGLVSSCQILDRIGGIIHIDSQIGKSNIIKIEIPAIVEVPIKVSEYENGLPTYKKVTGKSILLVDDEVDITDLLMQFLQQKGYIIDIAKDGREALDKVLIKDYDVIISDLKMPNGFTGNKLHGFVKRKNPELAQRMIFVTGDIINPETQKFLQSTGNQYLEKPFLLDSLMDKIKQMGVL